MSLVGSNERIALEREANELRMQRDYSGRFFSQSQGRRLDEIERLIGPPQPLTLNDFVQAKP